MEGPEELVDEYIYRVGEVSSQGLIPGPGVSCSQSALEEPSNG